MREEPGGRPDVRQTVRASGCGRRVCRAPKEGVALTNELIDPLRIVRGKVRFVLQRVLCPSAHG